MSKMREEFESWYISEVWPGLVRDRVINHLMSIEPCGSYTFRDTNMAWKVWQASRAAIEVEKSSCQD